MLLDVKELCQAFNPVLGSSLRVVVGILFRHSVNIFTAGAAAHGSLISLRCQNFDDGSEATWRASLLRFRCRGLRQSLCPRRFENVGAFELIDASIGEQPRHSWRKELPGCLVPSGVRA